MNPADTLHPKTPGAPPRTTVVWDLAQRLAHWTLALAVALAWLTAESERWRLVHVAAGLTAGGAAGFRLLWGVLGSGHARFADFVTGPARVRAYLRSLLSARPQHFTGHNPAGGWAILALLGLTVAAVGAGWLSDQAWGGHAMEEAHELLAVALLWTVGVHVLGVASGSWAHRENLVMAMLTGRKRAAPGEPPTHPRADGMVLNLLGLSALAAAVTVALWWGLQS